MEILTNKLWNSRQSAHYEALWSMGDHTHTPTRAKVEIKLDSCDFQSHAYVSFYDWQSKRWNRVASIPYKHMTAVREGINEYKPAEDAVDAFVADEEKLLNEAVLLLGPLPVGSCNPGDKQ